VNSVQILRRLQSHAKTFESQGLPTTKRIFFVEKIYLPLTRWQTVYDNFRNILRQKLYLKNSSLLKYLRAVLK